MSDPQSYRGGEAPASQQRSVSHGGSKVTSERVALLVLSALLAAAVIVIYRVSFDNLRTNKSFQTLRDEHEALKRNITDGSRPSCEEGWEQHGAKCYHFSSKKSTWNESRSECRGLGGDLVKIESTEEQEFLVGKLSEKMDEHEDKFWIGLTDSEEENKWLWVDGSPLDTSLTFWSNNEPDNWDGANMDGEDCVRMGDKNRPVLKCWFDKDCRVPHRRICDKPTKTLKCV